MIDNNLITEKSIKEIFGEEHSKQVVTSEDVVHATTESVIALSSTVEETPAVSIAIGEVSGVSLGTRVVVDHNASNPNQHTIGAITGLREELDNIKALQTIYSDKKQQADYYMWHDENATGDNRIGYFVSMHQSTSHDTLHGTLCCIEICDGDHDVFGVTVANAGFIGGQEYSQVADGTKVGRNHQYGLVVHSGLAAVQCESNVQIGDYVTSNSHGIAAKTNGKHGYLVVTMSDINGVMHAVIALTQSSVVAKSIADDVDDLSDRMASAEYNITSVTNVANSAYAMAQGTKMQTESAIGSMQGQIGEAVGKVESMGGVVSDLEDIIISAEKNAAQAKVIAQGAVSEVNQSTADVKDLINKYEPLDAWVDPETGKIEKSYVIDYMDANGLATKSEVETVDEKTEENLTAIQQNAKSIQSLASKIDKNAIGAYSQAYGLTLEQAMSTLETGYVYVPTVVHTETYSDYTQEFSLGYYYTWNSQRWIPSQSNAVNFSSEYFAGTNLTPYWNITISDVVHNDTTYSLGDLYYWEDGAWVKVASVADNTLSRAVSSVKQTANSLSIDISDVKGDVANIKVDVDENSSNIQNVTQWTKGTTVDGEDLYNIATIKQTADAEGSSLALVVADAEGNKVLKGASIILGQNEDESYITVDADQIVMNGTTTFLTPSDVGAGGSTVIDGARITTGQIDTDRLNVSDIIAVGSDNITTITEDTISTTNILAKNLQVEGANVKNLYANSIVVGGNSGQTVQDFIDKSIASTTTHYALSVSTITPPADDAWDENEPERDEGQPYMWQKTITVYGDGSVEERLICLDGKGVIDVDITSSTGTIYINNEIRSTLTAKVYQDSKDITHEFPDGAFRWEKYDMYGTKDAIWSYTGKTVAINNLDIYKRAMFNCILDVEQRL